MGTDGRASFVGDLKYKRTQVDEVKHPDIYQLLAYTIATDLPTGLSSMRREKPTRVPTTVVMPVKRLEIRALDISGTT